MQKRAVASIAATLVTLKKSARFSSDISLIFLEEKVLLFAFFILRHIYYNTVQHYSGARGVARLERCDIVPSLQQP